jgi:endoglucanase
MQVNWMGMAVFCFYICALGFYLWIRIAKTLDLGQYLGYGIFVLCVEVMGATTVILYGTNLLWNPVNEIVLQESEDGIGPGKLKVRICYDLLQEKPIVFAHHTTEVL